MISDKIAFVILTWNSEGYLADCLDSVLSLPADDLKIYIVDNGSSDNTPAMLEFYREKNPAQVNVMYLFENEGTTKSRNLALRKISNDTKWVCVLDSDTVVNAAAIEALIEALSMRPKAMLASPRMWKPGSGGEQLSCKHFPTMMGKILKGVPISSLQKRGLLKESYTFYPDSNTQGDPPVSRDKTIYKIDYAISACWMLKKDVLDCIGFLDEHIFYAPEDVDYCAMIWENGYEVLFISNASIYHNTQRLSRKKMISKINWIHIKGLIYYFRKHRYLFVKKQIYK